MRIARTSLSQVDHRRQCTCECDFVHFRMSATCACYPPHTLLTHIILCERCAVVDGVHMYIDTAGQVHDALICRRARQRDRFVLFTGAQ
jgi:hypothetical protein